MSFRRGIDEHRDRLQQRVVPSSLDQFQRPAQQVFYEHNALIEKANITQQIAEQQEDNEDMSYLLPLFDNNIQSHIDHHETWKSAQKLLGFFSINSLH